MTQSTDLEHDCFSREPRLALGLKQDDARLVMRPDYRWKYWHCEDFCPMPIYLNKGPGELVDLGNRRNHGAVRELMHECIFETSRKHHKRFTRTFEKLDAVTDKEPSGLTIGDRDEKINKFQWVTEFRQDLETAERRRPCPAL